jgi:two-component system sensor histidine kinase KdpD
MIIRSLTAAALVACLTFVLRLTDADAIVASLGYVTVIVLVALLGSLPAAIATVLSYLAMAYWFIKPVRSFHVSSFDDVVILIAFVVAATASAFTVSRVNGLRQRAEANERDAFEARVDAAVNENRAAFLSAMTHSLRTPLASIKATTTAVRDPSVPAAKRDELLLIASDETDRLDLLVTKVLELSRVRSGRLDPDREATDIVELARDAARRLRHLAEHLDVRVVVDGDVVIADVDPQMTEVVLLSLLENALQYAPRGTEVAVNVTAAPRIGCCISVIDHGRGVAPADRARVFDEFVRLDRSTNAGSGIGLTLVAAFSEAHGGTASVVDTAGGGATFIVALPGGEDA